MSWRHAVVVTNSVGRSWVRIWLLHFEVFLGGLRYTNASHFAIPMHRTSLYQCITLRYTNASHFAIPMHRTSLYQCIALRYTNASHFAIPMHHTSLYQCIALRGQWPIFLRWILDASVSMSLWDRGFPNWDFSWLFPVLLANAKTMPEVRPVLIFTNPYL
jgi:hypothetical protein